MSKAKNELDPHVRVSKLSRLHRAGSKKARKSPRKTRDTKKQSRSKKAPAKERKQTKLAAKSAQKARKRTTRAKSSQRSGRTRVTKKTPPKPRKKAPPKPRKKAPPKPRKKAPPKSRKKAPPKPRRSSFERRAWEDVQAIVSALSVYGVLSQHVASNQADVLLSAAPDTDPIDVYNDLRALVLHLRWYTRIGCTILTNTPENKDDYIKVGRKWSIDAYVAFRRLDRYGPAIVAFDSKNEERPGLLQRNSDQDIGLWLFDFGARKDGTQPHRFRPDRI